MPWRCSDVVMSIMIDINMYQASTQLQPDRKYKVSGTGNVNPLLPTPHLFAKTPKMDVYIYIIHLVSVYLRKVTHIRIPHTSSILKFLEKHGRPATHPNAAPAMRDNSENGHTVQNNVSNPNNINHVSCNTCPVQLR